MNKKTSKQRRNPKNKN